MEETQIPLSSLASFISQHTHDVRNGLNCLELEAALLQSQLSDKEAVEGLERMRKQLRVLGLQLRSLSLQIHQPEASPGPIEARVLMVIWKQKHESLLPDAPEVVWKNGVGDEVVNVDVEMIASVFRELMVNAAYFSKGSTVEVSALAEGGKVVFELQEPKAEAPDTSRWGQPFFTTRRNAYGLGLWSAGRMLSANKATLEQKFAPETKRLTSRITLPVFEAR